MQIKKISKNKGFTLVETLIYAVGMVLLLGVIASLVYYMYNWYQYATISSKVDQVGLTIMDRVVKDIRTGKDIDFGQSVFNNANGVIDVDAKVGGSIISKKFSVQNQRIMYQENGGTAEYLTPPNMSITSFYLKNITASTSKSVHIDLQITFNTRSGTNTHSYSGLSVLRSSYR